MAFRAKCVFSQCLQVRAQRWQMHERQRLHGCQARCLPVAQVGGAEDEAAVLWPQALAQAQVLVGVVAKPVRFISDPEGGLTLQQADDIEPMQVFFGKNHLGAAGAENCPAAANLVASVGARQARAAVDGPLRSARMALLGRNALHTASFVSRYGPPIRSMQ